MIGSPNTPMSSERRRAPRYALHGRLHSQIVSIETPVVVREMSLNGLSFQCAMPFPVGAIHEFHLRLGDDSEVQLRGRIVRSYEEPQRDGTRLYVTGVQFVDDDAVEDAGEIIEKIK